jgi:DNA ligase-associated metallophosphoesterase
MVKHIWHGQTFWLHPNRLMYWEEQNILIGSDLHLGKTGHFRKAGIAMPQQVYREDLQRLFAVIQHFNPSQLLIVGDLFHSEANKELDWFTRWRNDFSSTDFHLVKGNHDILGDDWYTEKGLAVSIELEIAGLRFVHEPFWSTVDRQQLTDDKTVKAAGKHFGFHASIFRQINAFYRRLVYSRVCFLLNQKRVKVFLLLLQTK